MKTDRVTKIKKKYGKHIFQKWGESGGSPILKAWKAGRLVPRR